MLIMLSQQHQAIRGGSLTKLFKMAEKVEIKMTPQLKEKVDAAREYIENKYSKMRKLEEDRKTNWNMFEEKVNDMRLSEQQKQKIRHEILQQESELLRKKRSKITANDFESLAVIGKGAFGQVRLCKEYKTNEIVAIKRLKKKQMLKKNQVAHIRAERNVLVHGNPWIVSLKYSFQDDVYLYLVMEFLQGGDLMTLLIKRNILTEDQSRFYISEMILAIESVHKMNYIHRDLKPDNILIDNRGHIKLSDFGLCKQTEIRKPDQRKQKDSEFTIPKPEVYLKNLPEIKRRHLRNRQLAYSAVGTPDYIAPQMLRQSGYTETVDWWSIGVMLYEMLVGYAPFSSDSNEQIYYKIEHHEEYLVFPDDVELSQEVIDLINGMVCEEEVRLGRNGVSQIKNHPWFKGFGWKTVHETKSPFVPTLKSNTDVSNFDHYDQEDQWNAQIQQKPMKKDFSFIGYTFKHDGEDNQRLLMVNALEKLQRTHSSMFRKPHTSQIKLNKQNNNKTDLVRYHIDDFAEIEETARSKQPLHPRESFKQNSSKMLKQFLKQDSNKIQHSKNVFKDIGYLPLKKPSTSKSPQHPIQKKAINNSQQPPNTKYECGTMSQLASRIQQQANQLGSNQPNKTPPSPNFANLMQSIKQKDHSKQREVTPRSFKASEKISLEPKPKTKIIGVKFKEYLK